MTLQEKICEAGVTTLAEFICEPCSGGSGVDRYVDSYSANIVDDVMTANVTDTLEANLVEDVFVANLTEETLEASLVDEILTGDIND